MDIAFLTTSLFGRAANGGELCSARLLGGLLRAGHRVHAIGRGPLPGADEGLGLADLRFSAIGPREPPFDSLPLARRLSSLLGAWRRGSASTVHRLAADGAPRRVASALTDRRVDAIIVDHLQAFAWLAEMPRAGSAWPPVLLMMHNLEAEGYDEAADLAAASGRRLHAAIYRREARLLRVLEGQALRQASVIACLSDGDARALRRRAVAHGAQAQVRVLPGYPLAADGWARAEPEPSPPLTAPARTVRAGVGGTRRRIGMLGTWTWRPNREGLDWMLQQVLPRLPADVELVLAGRGLPTMPASTRVRPWGWIEDVQQFYDAVDVVAVPSFSGSGVHEKSIEAVARGAVVVATPHALRGLGPDLPSHVHVATRPDDFARLCAHAGPGPRAAHGAQAWAGQRRATYGAALASCLHALGDASTRDAETPQPPSRSTAKPAEPVLPVPIDDLRPMG